MAPTLQNGKKRKAAEAVEPQPEPFATNVGLDMESEDEEAAEPDASDDDEVDEFPEIDTRSDSEEDEEYEDNEGQSEGDEEEDEEDTDEEDEEDETEAESSSDTELHIFPKAKTIISGITGQPKRVYPEIEPDYDSDSSTEDVCSLYVRPDFTLIYLTGYVHRRQIEWAMFLCIGMTICRTSVMILMARRSCVLREETSWISSWKQ